MKNFKTISYCLMLMSIGLLFTGCPGGSAGSSGGVTEKTYSDNEDGTWLILIHFGVDNNIDYAFEENDQIVTNYLQTLESIEAADINNVLDIVVLMDAYNTAGNFQDGYYHLTGGTFATDLVTSITEINSGSVPESEDFIDWAFTIAPNADYHVYSVFNHGGGFADANIAGTYGIAYDEDGTHNDSLSHDELGQLTEYVKMKNGNNNIELFFPYACLMGGVELAYQVKDSVNFMTFSEENFPADYWSWEGLEEILSNPGISGANLGKAICNSANTYFRSVGRSFTLATIDEAKISNLANSLDTFAEQASIYIGSNQTRAAYFEDAAMNAIPMGNYYIDIKLFMNNISVRVPNLATYASSALHDLDDARVIFRAFDADYGYDSRDYESAGGLSVFHNTWAYKTSDYEYSLSLYNNILTFGNDTSWSDYIQTVMAQYVSQGDSYEPDNWFNEASAISIGVSQYHNFHIAGDNDFMQITLNAGQDYTIRTSAGSEYADTVLLLYKSSDTSTPIAVNDDINLANGNYYSKINYTPSATATYYIVCIDGYECLGDYNMEIVTGTYGSSFTSDITPDFDYSKIPFDFSNFQLDTEE